MAAITKGFEELHILREYHHRNADNRNLGIKMPIDYAEDLVTFVIECAEFMNGVIS